MQYNNQFTMQDLMQNRKLASVLPQFYKKGGLKKEYRFHWMQEKITKYLKGVLGGRVQNSVLVVKGNHREKLKEIKRLKAVLESLLNDIPSIAQNIQKNTRLLLPIENLEQVRERKTVKEKLQILEWILENIKYNPDFQINKKTTPLYLKEQKRWLKKVGIQ